MARPEDYLQEQIVKFIRLAAPSVLVYAIPNEAVRSARTGAAMKRRGLLPGMPDLCLVEAGGRSFYLEVKIPNGRLSPAQAAMSTEMLKRSIPRATVRSLRDVEVALREWRLI